MRELFSMDKKDYKGTEKVFRRPSARAIIEKNGKMLLVHSGRYNYYKFPGGGIEAGETYEEALAREVLEETGYKVIPGSIKEYGTVMRRQLDTHTPNTIFEQLNLYYTCEVEDEQGQCSYSGYEIDDGFSPRWIDPTRAEAVNRNCNSLTAAREMNVIHFYEREKHQKAKAKHDAEMFAKMGDADYAGMMEFVKEHLAQGETEDMSHKKDLRYSRFEHTRRVLAWAIRLYDAKADKSAIKFEDVMIATIFHDVGRFDAFKLRMPHATAGIATTKNYLVKHGYDEARADYIASLVGRHSDKDTMNDPNVDPNLLLLMEADLMDDMGALGTVMDCMIVQGRYEDASFDDCFYHVSKYTQRQQHQNPMTTPEGKRLWDKKTKLVDDFMNQLRDDLAL